MGWLIWISIGWVVASVLVGLPIGRLIASSERPGRANRGRPPAFRPLASSADGAASLSPGQANGSFAATSGSASILGFDCLTDGLRIREIVGYMPESDCLPLDVSATEFLVHMARMSGLPANSARERTADTLRHVGLYEERYRPIGGYSTGMKQRVKLAQSLVHDPKLGLEMPAGVPVLEHLWSDQQEVAVGQVEHPQE